MPDIHDLLKVVQCQACRETNLRQYNFCWRCGAPPALVSPRAPLSHDAVQIDTVKLTARRDQVMLAMAGRAGQKRKRRVADLFDDFLRSFSGGRRGWSDGTPDDVFDWLCFLDSHGGGTKWVHQRTCPGLGLENASACEADSACGKFYACETLRVGFVSKLRMAYKELLFRGDAWDPTSEKGNPCASPLVESYITYVSETQKQGGVEVKQAAPLLIDTLAKLLANMRIRAMSAESLAESISITRDVALFSLAFYTMKRGFDISNTLGSQLLRLPESAGWIVNFQFGKTTRVSKDAKVVAADPDSEVTCPLLAVEAYLDAAASYGWNLSTGHLFPVVTGEGKRGQTPLLAHQMTAALQQHLRVAGLPDHYTMHSFRVGGSVNQSLAGTPIDAIMDMGGWKTRRMAEHYVGATCSGNPGTAGGFPLDEVYGEADAYPLSPGFQEKYAACRQR